MPHATLLKRLDAWFGPAACRLWSTPQRAPVQQRLDDTPGRLLVIRPGGIGDMVMLLPVLKSLQTRFADRQIDVVCETRNAEVLEIAGFKGKVLCYAEHPIRTLTHLRRQTYAAVIDTEQFHHFSAFFAGLCGAPIRVGFRINPQRNGIYSHLVGYDLDGREDHQFQRLLQAVAPDASPPGLPGLLTQTAGLDPLPAALQAPEGPYLALHVGASTRHKRWPSDRFTAVCQRLQTQRGWHIVLLGTRADQEAARAIATALPSETCHDWTAALSLRQVATVCSRAALLLGPDSGLAHLAVALGTPTVTLFGPSDPAKWRIPGPQHAVVRHPLPCSPCSIFGYVKPCATLDCLMRIQPDDVMQAISLTHPARCATSPAP